MKTDKLMELQRAEFDAAARLAKEIRRHQLTPVVDDDYPEIRREYELAAAAYVEARQAVIDQREVEKRPGSR